MNTITYLDKEYKIGTNATPLELSDNHIAPTQSPRGWKEIRDPFDMGRDYCRCYISTLGLRVILTAALEADHQRWLHISVSHRGGRLPTWGEMTQIKELFCGTEATAYQIHPPKSRYVNIHEKCLHLWCPLDGPITPDFTRGGETI